MLEHDLLFQWLPVAMMGTVIPTWVALGVQFAGAQQNSELDGACADVGFSFARPIISLLKLSETYVGAGVGGPVSLECLRGSEHSGAAPFLLLTYLTMSTVLFLNMLIAMLTRTFDMNVERSAQNYQSSLRATSSAPSICRSCRHR